ncbi:MAG TPA: LCCL domain-containing protein [Myxococcota bacterium]|nr:LCCL domain-containing protein [Myxococcota bacterium]HRY97007.1 LCCL domain-containing protein [Myxococcota bacterium]HSA21251.1 LCCL domain-containing protein [Myxococcota bacterium]
MRASTWAFLAIGCSLAALPGAARAGEEALPPEARAVLEEFQRTEAAAAARAEAKMEPIRQALEAELAPARDAAERKLRALQDQYTRAGKLDEALALREAARQVSNVRQDPGNLSLSEKDIGRTYLYEVTGSTQGSVWGSEVFTSDSHLGTAAVHSGVLQPGQPGVVRVRVLGPQKSFMASTRNGVTSNAYGPWHISFTVEKVRAER